MTRWRAVAMAIGLAVGPGDPVRAADRFLLQGIVDLEAFATDSESLALSRNGGDPAAVGRLQAWAAFQLTTGLQAYLHMEAESDDSSGTREHAAELEQAGLRWTHAGRQVTVVDVGRFLTPFGVVMARNLSTRNPLIGAPSSIYTGYPEGIKLAASAARFDYYAALVNTPAILEDYLPESPGTAFRPDLGVGFSPSERLRAGLSWTRGPYLGGFAGPGLPAGRGWKDYEQNLYGFDIEYSRGYFEAAAMAFRSRYDLPGGHGDFEGTSYVAELKYTWTPRLFSAVRYERNAYPFLRLARDGAWFYRDSIVHDLEVGLGYRLGPDLQIKFAYRQDRRSAAGSARRFPDGWSFAAQLSWGFDLGRLLGGGY